MHYVYPDSHRGYGNRPAPTSVGGDYRFCWGLVTLVEMF